MRNNVVELTVFTHKCNDVNCEHAVVRYEIRLWEDYVEAKLIRYALKQNPYKFKIERKFFLDWLLSLNPMRKDWKGIGNMRIEDFIKLASYIFPQDYHIRLKSIEIDEAMYLDDFAKLLHSNTEHYVVNGWKDLLLRRGSEMFRPHSEFYNPFWFDYRNKNFDSELIESSTEEIEKFLNMLYEINPELIKTIEKVVIDEDQYWYYGHIYMHKALRNCIKEAWWSRSIDLISASDSIRYNLRYDKSCIEKLAKNLNLKKIKV